MELRLYARMLLSGWWIIALAALGALNVALVLSYLATPMYRASAQFLIAPNASITENSRDLVNSLEALDKRSIVSTYAEVLGSGRLFEQAGTLLGLDPATLADYEPKAVVLPEASILELSVEGPNPHIAAQLANNSGQLAIAYVRDLYQVYQMDFLDQASAPRNPFSPQPLRDAALALALGAVVGAALAVLREQLRTPLEALLRLTMVDSLSSAFTRRHLERRLQDLLVQAPEGVVSLGVVQLDGLRDLLDTLPPQVAQRLMHTVTGILRNELRGNDSVGRWNETAFAVLLPATPSAAAARTMQRIYRALSAPIEVDQNETVRLQPFVGVATGRGDKPLRVIVEWAEAALEKARQHTTQHVFFLDGTRGESVPTITPRNEAVRSPVRESAAATPDVPPTPLE